MTESRGAMTAQQFWDKGAWKTMSQGRVQVAIEFADALSAHNTAQLTQELHDARCRLIDYESADLQIAEIHAKELADHEKEVAELRAALEVKEKELALLQADSLEVRAFNSQLDNDIEGLKAELSRLRSQGAGQPEEAAKEICELLSFTDLTNVYAPEGYRLRVAEIIRKHAPVEGAGQWEAGRDAAANLLNAESYFWKGSRDDYPSDTARFYESKIRALQPPAGLASPPLEDLKLYGIHLPPCASYGSVGNETMECDCGLSAAIKRLASPPESTMETLDRLLKESGATVKFGLEAQGHIPTVEKLRSQGKSWDEIGKEIGWHGPTVEKFYGYHLEREGKKVSPPEGQV